MMNIKALRNTNKNRNNIEDCNTLPLIDTGFPYGKEYIPFFSVCIPTYNRSRMLSSAIESVLNQEFQDFELIICDNASTDSTEQIIQKYNDPRIRYVRYGKLVSMYANHNRCFTLSRAKWIVFLHSDDQLMANALAKLKQIILGQVTKDTKLIAPLSASHGHASLERFLPPHQSCVNLSKENGLVDMIIDQGGFSPSGCCYCKATDNAKLFDEFGINADRAYSLLTLLDGYTVLMHNENLVFKLEHEHSFGTLAYNNADWHISLAKTTQLVTEHQEWINIQPEVTKKIAHFSNRSQLDFLICLAQARKWHIFLTLVAFTSKKIFLSVRVIHILFPLVLGNRYFIAINFIKKIKLIGN